MSYRFGMHRPYQDPASADLAIVWRTPGTGMIVPESWDSPSDVRDPGSTDTDSEGHGGLGEADDDSSGGDGDDAEVEGEAGGGEGEQDSEPQGSDADENAIVVLPTSDSTAQALEHNPPFHTEDVLFPEAPLIPHFAKFTTSTSIMGLRVDAGIGASVSALARGIPRAWWGRGVRRDESFIPFALVSAEDRRARLMKASRAFAQDFPRAGPTCDLHCVASPEGLFSHDDPKKTEGRYTLGCWKGGHRSTKGLRDPANCPTKSWAVNITAEEEEE